MKVWRLVAHDTDPSGAIDIGKQRGKIAIGWTDIGDLDGANFSDFKEIGKLIRKEMPHLKDSNLGGPSLWNFYERMAVGDLVIMTAQSKRVCVFEVTGSYFYESESKSVLGYRHQRAVCLTDIDPEELWQSCDRPFAVGQGPRWTLAECSKSDTAERIALREGERYSVNSSVYERNPIARRKCIDHFGCECYVCKTRFDLTYGALGDGYIHIHHKVDISLCGGAYEVDPVKDLIPLCPNCHAMIHKSRPAMSLEELVSIYAQNNA